MEILRNTQGRVFVSVGLFDDFKYYGAMSVGPIEKTLPAIEPVLTMDAHGTVVKIAEIKDHDVNPSTASLTGYVPLRTKSSLENLIKKGGSDIQIHYGACTNPSDFNAFESALVLRGVSLTNYSLSEPTTLTPNRATIQESANIVVDESYRVFTPTLQKVFGETGITTLLGVAIADSSYCSIPYKNLDILIGTYNFSGYLRFAYSFDNGINWNVFPELFEAHSGSVVTSTIKVVENKIYWTHVGTEAYISVVDVDTIINNSPAITTVLFAHGTYAAIRDIAATKNYLWCVGGSGASFMVRIDLTDYTTEILDDDINFAGVSANAVDALNDNFVVTVGENDNFSLYKDGEFYLSTIGIDSMAFLSDVKVLNEQHWVVASDMGLYITKDGGITWEKTYSVDNKCKLSFYDDLVGYAANSSGVYRTMNGGRTWYKIDSRLWSGVSKLVMDNKNPNNLFMLETFGVYSTI
ncbi:MAG: hypothetical protein EKK57_09755 [Proteobacteria bacterium]|nr:MAG: hypothetical protein EKK57_09755 [Pseudomonadota bacterium]